MLKHSLKQSRVRIKRKLRVRKQVRGDSMRPRLCINRTNKNIFAQIIDDEKGVTLASISTTAKEFKGTEFNRKSKSSAKKLGERLAELAKEKSVTAVVFDRGSHKYHGIVAELADGARAGGLKF
ncbi:MAG: 50S ribosomal protein L18 [Simkaniaceae bacterium]|nr:50S ribosomal protein L18 [Simkaniaceae bacterium]